MTLFENPRTTSVFDPRWSIAEVVRRSGKPVWRQAVELVRTHRGPGQMDPPGYYGMGLWRREFDWDTRYAYVSARASNALNFALSPPDPEALTQHSLLSDKMLTAFLLQTQGIAVPEVLATLGAPRYRGIRTIETAEALSDFLHQVPLPIFGKPTHSSRNIGAFSLWERDGQRGLMGNGKWIDLRAAAQALLTGFPAGYMLQSFIPAHPLLAQFSPRTLATLRIVTLIEAGEPELLYALLRLPGEASNVDDFAATGAVYALLKPEDGSIDVARSGNYLRGQAVDTHAPSGISLSGFAVPHWQDSLAICRAAHHLLPTHGVIGFDVAVTPTGPLIVEANARPQHVLYQLASDRPFRKGTIWERIEQVLAEKASTRP